MAYELRSARYIAADCLKQIVREGDTVVDATMGNGHDTLMLAQLVGTSGHVIGFDVQAQAVESSRRLLEAEGVIDRCTLHVLGHEHMAEKVQGTVRAVVFNLGWLPGGDKSVTTLWETTQTAVTAALSIVEKGGVVTICAYPGHAAGDYERAQLMEFLSALRPQEYNVLHHRFLNAGPGAPECFIMQRQ